MQTPSNELAIPRILLPQPGHSGATPVFLMSRPRDDWAIRGRANVFAKDAVSPDAAAAQQDWDLIANAIVDAGGAVVVVDNPSPWLTGLPYTAEAGFLGQDAGGLVFVLPRLTPAHRQAEPPVVQAAIESLGLRTLTLPADVHFEGQGDVIDVGPAGTLCLVCTSGQGTWARSDVNAFDAYQAVLPGASLHLGFHADPWFHGNTFLGAWRKGPKVVVAVCFEALRDDGAERLRRFIEAGSQHAQIIALTPAQTLTYATNALQVNDTVLAPAGVPAFVVDAWGNLGLTVRFLDLPALFGKGGGAAVCLTNRLWGFDVDQIPARAAP